MKFFKLFYHQKMTMQDAEFVANSVLRVLESN